MPNLRSFTDFFLYIKSQFYLDKKKLDISNNNNIKKYEGKFVLNLKLFIMTKGRSLQLVARVPMQIK